MTDTASHDGIGLDKQTQAKIRGVFSNFLAVEEAILYGSRAMGTYRPGSDIDLTLKGCSLSWRDLQQVEVALDDLLLPYRFDLSLYDQIDNPDLLAHIGRVGIVFYSREG
ncbi:nucleotidyltransferase domain-containing protein [Modicisalibacter radicis]|uniref:nucleotidyltransferase domain-containing protein n=1 Tax=Halomonas sp. EAR18 TaxID=2518972 RepID=UPI00109CE99B|nr:nucleotidyltransferase domain-containing protein [Halomonas sp. EAR18]